VSVGDYVFDWELGLWGLIVNQLPCDSYVLLYEDGIQGEAFENALSSAEDRGWRE